MKILVTGKGGREHAIISTLRENSDATIFAYPGSDAIADLATQVDAKDLLELVAFMQREKIDLCIAGEESYLVKDRGLANLCAEAGIPCWGPLKESAQLEASKTFAKHFLKRHNIPTAAFSVVHTKHEAQRAISGYPVVLKFDGLAAAILCATVLGVYGVLRARTHGLDDRLSWVLIPFLGFTLAGCALNALVYGLMSTENWNARFNPGKPIESEAGATGKMTVAGLITALFLGTTVLMASLAFTAQRFFEYQAELAHQQDTTPKKSAN